MSSMSSVMVELANWMSVEMQKIGRTGYECEIIIFSENEIKWDSDTYVFHYP
jgi:hypothetical protein